MLGCPFITSWNGDARTKLHARAKVRKNCFGQILVDSTAASIRGQILYSHHRYLKGASITFQILKTRATCWQIISPAVGSRYKPNDRLLLTSSL